MFVPFLESSSELSSPCLQEQRADRFCTCRACIECSGNTTPEGVVEFSQQDEAKTEENVPAQD